MFGENTLFYWAPPVAAAIALVYAFIKASWVGKQDPGDDRMQMISKWISDGAMAFLKTEYKYLAIFVVCVAILLGISNAGLEDSNVFIALSFIIGAICSGTAG